MKKYAVLAVLSAALMPLPAAVAAVQTAKAPAARPAKAQGVWIDVRSPEEYRAGHLQGALNIPVEQIGARAAAAAPDKNTPLHLYCRSGSRAQEALEVLKKMGYTNVTNHGGYGDLVKKGLK